MFDVLIFGKTVAIKRLKKVADSRWMKKTVLKFINKDLETNVLGSLLESFAYIEIKFYSYLFVIIFFYLCIFIILIFL